MFRPTKRQHLTRANKRRRKRRNRPAPRPIRRTACRSRPRRRCAVRAIAGSRWCPAPSSSPSAFHGMSFSARLSGLFFARAHIADADWMALIQSSRLFDALDADERARLRELTARFLAKKKFVAAAGHVLTNEQRHLIAALACLPVLNRGFEWLAGWRQVIVYPGEFRVKREHHDDVTGVVTEGEDDLIGEAWEHGPVILSWADVATDLAQPFDGFNVVAHEIAHKLDMLDGAMNGVPRLPRDIPRREWIATL